MSEWKPIETAPKDRYILATVGSDPENQFIVKWRNGNWQIKQLPGRDHIVNLLATHWAPLPEPPS
jgi:hypothetical protein